MLNPWVQPDPCGLGWVGLMWWVGLGWIFFDPLWWVGWKNPLNPTQPNPCTPLLVGTAGIFSSTKHGGLYVPVYLSVWYILAVPAGTVQNRLPCLKLLYLPKYENIILLAYCVGLCIFILEHYLDLFIMCFVWRDVNQDSGIKW